MNSSRELDRHWQEAEAVQKEIDAILARLESVSTRYKWFYATRHRGYQHGLDAYDDPYEIRVEHQIGAQTFSGLTTPPDICLVIDGLREKLSDNRASHSKRLQLKGFLIGFLNVNWSSARSEGLKYAIPVLDNILCPWLEDSPSER